MPTETHGDPAATLPRSRRHNAPSTETPDAHELLLGYEDKCKAIKATLRQRIALLQAHLRLLESVEHNHGAPVAVRSAAAARYNDSRRALVVLRACTVAVNIWHDEIDRLLPRAERQYLVPIANVEVNMARLLQLQGDVEGYQLTDTMDAINANRHFLQTNVLQVGAALRERLLLPACPRPRNTGLSRSHHSGGSGGGPRGAIAADAGRPQVTGSYYAGYSAGEDTLARYFAYGERIDNDNHHRRFTFDDGSYVDIQAHEPQYAHSGDSKMVGLMSIAAAALFGGVIAGPAGAVVGASAALVANVVAIPYDVYWQGHTALFYRSARSPTYWGVVHFYGETAVDASSASDDVAGTPASSVLPNFADDVDAADWYVWKSGSADARAPLLCQQASDALVQAMGSWPSDAGAAAASSGGASLHATGNLLASPQLLSASTG